MSNESNRGTPNLFDQLVDQYKLEKHLGKGGVTDIYLAYDVDENQKVAVEILLPYLADNKSFNERFIAKMRQASQIKHKNIAQVLQVSHTPFNNRPYIAREHVDAFTLRKRMQQLKQQDTPVNSVYALKLVRQIAEALALTERLEIFHYDLQPEKVLLQQDGRVILADIGVPRLKNVDTSSRDTHLNPNYWSNEQIQGKPLDARSHVYSLGVILFELLTGELPATAGSLLETVKTSSKRKSLDVLRSDLSNETYKLVKRALRLQQWAKYGNCKELIAAIDEAIKAEEFLISAGVTEQRRSISSLWLKFAVPIGVLAVLLVIGLFVFSGGDGNDTVAAVPTIPPVTETAVAVVPPPTSSPIATATHTPEPVIANVAIFEPSEGQNFATNETISFRWTWLEPLAANEQFLVQVFSPTQNFVVSRVLQPDEELTYLAEVPGSAFPSGPGSYTWQVILLSPESGTPIARSEQREIVITEPATATAQPSTTPTVTTAPTSTPSPIPTAAPQVVVIFSSISLREGPSTRYNIISFLEEGDVVTVLSINKQDGTWYNVLLDDGTLGWVSITVVEAVDDGSETAVTAVPTAATIPASPTPTNTHTPTPTFTPTPLPPSSGGGGGSGGGPSGRPTLTPPPP